MYYNELENNWTLWFHEMYNKDWSINSYKKIVSFKTLDEAILLFENMNYNIFKKNSIFLMKNNIKPIWEDENNKNGGCISYKILENDVVKVVKLFSYHIICNILSDIPENHLKINGISISPKKSFSIIKIWLCDETIINDDIINNNTDIFNIDILFNIDKHICIYKKHTLLY